MKKSGAQDMVQTASVYDFKPRTGKQNIENSRPAGQTFYKWAMAAAAMFLLVCSVFYMSGSPDNNPAGHMTGTVDVAGVSSQDGEIQTVPVYEQEIEKLARSVIEEELIQQELMSMWQMADSSSGRSEEQEIETFLDDLFDSDVPQESFAPENEQLDLWELYMIIEDEYVQKL
jgi:hypothetical protein